MYLMNVNQVLWGVPQVVFQVNRLQNVGSQSTSLVSLESLLVLKPHFTPTKSEPLRVGPKFSI